MSVRRLRTLLWLSGAAFWALAIGLLAWGCLSPQPNHEPAPARTPAGPKTAHARDARSLPSLKEFEKLWTRPLRQPLYDPPPSAPAPAEAQVAKPRAPLALQLLGTAIEPNRATAIFLTGKNTIEIKGVGEQVDAARVLAIDAHGVVLEHHGQKTTLELKPNTGRPTP